MARCVLGRSARTLPSGAMTVVDKSQIDLRAPLRLSRAAEIAFPGGGMTASGLRREAAKGRLAIERIAGKDFTTLAAIEDMRAKCVQPQHPYQPDSGSDPSIEPAKPFGLSKMADSELAQVALNQTLKELNERSRGTSPPNTRQKKKSNVIQIKPRA
jgi:hypothetical protein